MPTDNSDLRLVSSGPASDRSPSVATPNTAALKALAHPDRLRMLGLLRFDGPATATGLAKRLGLNSGATSYHLRQLAEHGLIEEAGELGNKRERWWRARHEMTHYDPTEIGDEAMDAGMAMVQAVFYQHIGMMERALREFPGLPVAWRQTSNVSDYTMALTAKEALALKEKLMEILWEAVRQSPAQGHTPAPGKRNYTVMLHAFPFADDPDKASEDSSTR